MIDVIDCEPKTLIKPQINSWMFNDVLVIILQNKNANFTGTLKPYDLPICGKKMWEWVAMCAEDCTVKTTTCTDESNVLSLIKPLLTNAKYTVVLYSDTPLIQRNTFVEVLDYATTHEINVLKLTRGYVFNTEYIKNVDSISATQTQYFNEEDFMVVYDYKQLAIVTYMMNNRILEFHMKNGVLIEDLSSIKIDADVVIENGVKIMANNVIKGMTLIQKNALINCGNYIESSIISNDTKILNSTIIGSKVSPNLVVGPYEYIKGKSV